MSDPIQEQPKDPMRAYWQITSGIWVLFVILGIGVSIMYFNSSNNMYQSNSGSIPLQLTWRGQILAGAIVGGFVGAVILGFIGLVKASLLPNPNLIHCPNCRKSVIVPPSFFGRSVDCPHCKSTFTAEQENGTTKENDQDQDEDAS